MTKHSSSKDYYSGINNLIQGAKLLAKPQLRLFIIVPLLVNMLIFSLAFWFLFSSITAWIESYMGSFPSYLSWFTYIIWPFLVISLVFTFSFLFSAIANIIAAPFNGLLAEKTEKLISGQLDYEEMSITDLLKDMPRILKRELQKVLYYIPRIIGCFLLFLVPVVGQTIAPIIWFLFAGWMMAIQYLDFPFDNHKISFKEMKATLAKDLIPNLTFGLAISFCTTLPLLNLIIMPIAVCGATFSWVERYKDNLKPFNPVKRSSALESKELEANALEYNPFERDVAPHNEEKTTVRSPINPPK